MAVDPLFAQWLQSPADTAVRASAAAIARWGNSAITTERVTGMALKADAEAEADRQLSFFARGPFATEAHVVTGTDWQASLGRVVTFVNERLGYAGGLDVLVTGVEIDRATGMSTITVLRPLRGAA